MLKAIEDEVKGSTINLHGGEPLTIGHKNIDTLLSAIYKKNGKSGIQTNATLIDDEYIEMFKKYKTNIGISFDGPEELNEYRVGTDTEKVHNLIFKLKAYGLNVSIISVVSKANAGTDNRLEKFANFIIGLGKAGISGRLNPCGNSPDYQLPDQRLTYVYRQLFIAVLKGGGRWSPFIDILNSLKGKDAVCSLRSCDPFHTEAARVVLGDGTVTNCMRLSDKGLYYRQGSPSSIRSSVLRDTPQENGGCKGCRWFECCHGGCPSLAIDNDWRNRTTSCSLYKELFEIGAGILRNE